eukprot:COSAG01_NODE_9064_length_2564_cov_2.841849_3_plen_87_part_00
MDRSPDGNARRTAARVTTLRSRSVLEVSSLIRVWSMSTDALSSDASCADACSCAAASLSAGLVSEPDPLRALAKCCSLHAAAPTIQ